MQRTLSDWGGNLVAFAIVILLNVLSNALPINGQTMPEISAKYPSLFTPAGFTFSIWGVIYLALLVFVIWQALPAQRNNGKVAAVSKYFQLNCLMNAAWIVVWHYDLLALSFVVMLAILTTLILIYRALIASINAAPFLEHIVLYLPFSLYIGWITLATIANASVLQNGNGWDNVWLSAVQWTLLKLAVAGAIGATMILRNRDVPFALAIAWGAYGISAMQSATPEVAGAAMTLSLLTLILVAVDGARRLAAA
jgi:benzodiazapine receptor